MLPEFSTEAGRVSREKEPRESVDRNFEVLKSLGAEEILGVIEHKQAVKVEERTEPPAAPAETSTVRWSLGEKVAREERLNRLTQLRFLQVDKHEGYREEGRLLGLWMEELWLPSHLHNRTSFSHSFQLWLIRSKFREL